MMREKVKQFSNLKTFGEDRVDRDTLERVSINETFEIARRG